MQLPGPIFTYLSDLIMGEYSIGDAMKKFLRGSRLKGDIQAMQITDIWEKLMGKTIAKYTDSIKIYGDKLYISTKVAPLRQELLFQKENIILRVNEALKENVIKEVIINWAILNFKCNEHLNESE